MIEGLLILLGLQFVGELISFGLQIPVPGNVIGMVLLTLALKLRWIKVRQVQAVCDPLLKNMAFLFVPPGVGLMMYFDLIGENLVAILLSTVLSTFIVLAVVGTVQQKME